MGFWNHKGHEGFLGQAASRKSRVNLSYCGHAVARNRESKSTALLFHAKARRLEGECPHEPPSAVRKDGRDERRSSAGKQTLAPPCASQARWQEWRVASGWCAKMGNVVAFVPLCEVELGCGLCPH